MKRSPRFVLITGLSGAGKSHVLRLFEDRGYYCVDNLPAALVPTFAKLVAEADVFLTSMLEGSRERMKVTYEDLSAVNPRLVYARGHGQGTRGPDAGKPGFDGHTWWARGGITYALSPTEDPGSLPGRKFA